MPQKKGRCSQKTNNGDKLIALLDGLAVAAQFQSLFFHFWIMWKGAKRVI
jgi:hypothetical protein